MQNTPDVSEENKTMETKKFAGMDDAANSSDAGRTTEEVRQARTENTKTDGGTHGGSHSAEQKQHHDSGGKEGNTGAHPF